MTAPRLRRAPGTGTIRPRGAGWQARFTLPGGKRVTATLDNRSDAGAWLAEQRSRAASIDARAVAVRDALASELAGQAIDAEALDRAALAALAAADGTWP
jgi:hypothetical protein